MRRKVEIEMSGYPQTSTNILSRSIASPRHPPQQLTRRESIPFTYSGIASQQIQPGICLNQSALPPSHLSYSFINVFPFVLFSVLKQIHVLYLILVGGFMLFKYCDIQWQVLVVQLTLTIAYILIEIFCRHFTFIFYTKYHCFADAEYQVWNHGTKQWDDVFQQDIKIGHILKVKNKKREAGMENSMFADDNNGIKIRVPVNILPIRVQSGEREISIDTFDTDKQEAEVKIGIFKNFQKYFHNVQNEPINYVKPIISEQVTIQYTFSNPVSQSFQATLSFVGDMQTVTKQFSNAETIPRGAYFCNEQQLVGIVLYNLEQKNFKHLKQILGSRNSIALLLQKHLLTMITINLIISLLLLGLNAIVSWATIRTTFKQYFHCYFFTYVAELSYSMNVTMYIILGLHQIIDSFLIKQKCNVRMNNYIKSVDEFGVADTFVMDQFTFVKKNILKVANIEINRQQSTLLFDQQTILIIIQKSSQFQAKYQNQWLSLAHYYQLNYGRGNMKKKMSINVQSQKTDTSGSIRMIVCFETSQKYIVKFNQKIIFSILDSVTIQKQLIFSQKISQGKQNGELMLMLQILQMKNDYGMDLSTVMYQMQFKFLCLIKLRFVPKSKTVDFLKYLKNKYKIVIMSSSSIEYFQKIMLSAHLKSQKDYVIHFEQMQETDFQKELTLKVQEFKKNKFKSNDIEQNIRKSSGVMSEQNICLSSQVISQSFRKTNQIKQQKSKEEKGDLILAIHSGLIIYLGRPKIRKLLKQLAQISTYIIFYNCTQFQKQLCAANVFKIFPEHIFLSNFAIDANIFKISHLSMCIFGHSAQRYSTACADSYTALQQFISKQCVTSIELTTIIIKTHIFKNQCLIWSMFSASLFIYKTKFMFFGQQYTTFIFYFFNIAFTILPIFYYLISRPQLIGDIMVEDYKDYKLRYEHIKGILSGILITFISYSFISESEIQLVFVAVLINCTFMANFYHLVIDDSASKKKQVCVIILQCAISIGAYFLVLFVDSTYRLFNVDWVMRLYLQDRVLFFCTVFLINPFLIYLLFLFMSFHKSILMKDRRIEKKQLENENIKKSIKKQQIIAKVLKSGGKQMRFRTSDSRSDFL